MEFEIFITEFFEMAKIYLNNYTSITKFNAKIFIIQESKNFKMFTYTLTYKS